MEQQLVTARGNSQQEYTRLVEELGQKELTAKNTEELQSKIQ